MNEDSEAAVVARLQDLLAEVEGDWAQAQAEWTRASAPAQQRIRWDALATRLGEAQARARELGRRRAAELAASRPRDR